MLFTINSALMNACILSVLEKGDSYGYQLTQRLQSKMECSETTLYPVLRRLEREHLLSSYNREENGRNRKFYSITAEGMAMLASFRKEWISYKKVVDGIMEGDV